MVCVLKNNVGKGDIVQQLKLGLLLMFNVPATG